MTKYFFRGFRFVLQCLLIFSFLLGSARAEWQFAAGLADGDHLDDLALIGRGEWYVWMSAKNYAMEGPYDVDLAGGLYTVGDIDGDRKADLAMLSGSRWHLWRSGNNYVREGPYDCGVDGGVPYLFDFDGDGKSDPCVVTGYRWHVWHSNSDYNRPEQFGDGTLVEPNLIPVAFDSAGGILPRGTYYGYMKDGWLEFRRYRGSYRQKIKMVQGVPVRGLFDDNPGDDLIIMQRKPDGFEYHTWLSSDRYNLRGPYQLNSGNAPGVAAMAWQDTLGCYAAASVYNIKEMANVGVSVNGQALGYNHKLSFTTSAGRRVSLDLPFYYSSLPNVKTGNQVACSVYVPGPSGPSLMYRSKPAVMPGKIRMLTPPAGARLDAGKAVGMTWTPAAGVQGYLAYYHNPDDYTDSEDGAWLIQYLPGPRTGFTIPAGKTVSGPAQFGALALNGDVQALTGSQDVNDCFMVTAAWDETAARITTPTPVPVPTPYYLGIAKTYSVKEEGLRFTIRETNPYQMPHPGTVAVSLKMRKWRISIAFVTVFDMEGNEYYTWSKLRIYKRKNKKYTVIFPCRPGSTVVIGTHKASFRSAVYDFSPGRFFNSRDLAVYPDSGARTFREKWEESAGALWSGYTPAFLIDSGDYDGDGTADPAVYRFSTGLWAVRELTRVYFGTPDDFPVPGDYDGDGTAEIAVFRPETGLWAVRGGERRYFGRSGDFPVPGDYDGDGTAETAIFRPGTGLWAARGSTRCYFGAAGDIPVPGYYTLTGEKIPGVFRPASGLWAIRGGTRFHFGAAGDSPVPGDYGGDGIWDAAVFRSASGLWAIRGLGNFYFGAAGDFPVSGGWTGTDLDLIGIFRKDSGLWAQPGLTRFYFGSGLDVPVSGGGDFTRRGGKLRLAEVSSR